MCDVMCDVGYLCVNFSLIGLSVLELGPMYATDRQTSDVRQKHRLMPPPYGIGGTITYVVVTSQRLYTCGARHSDIDVDVFFTVKF